MQNDFLFEIYRKWPGTHRDTQITRENMLKLSMWFISVRGHKFVKSLSSPVGCSKQPNTDQNLIFRSLKQRNNETGNLRLTADSIL